MSGRLLVVAALRLGAAATGCSGGATAAPTPASPPAAADRLVLVSGRDDHGMVAQHRVTVYDAPEGAHAVGRIVDGTLARVVDSDGQWLRVTTVEGAAVTGWVDDFHLRGEVRLVGAAPSCATTVAGSTRDGGTLAVVRELRRGRVRVETVTPPVVEGWASRADVQELPPQGPHCGDIPPEDRHAH